MRNLSFRIAKELDNIIFSILRRNDMTLTGYYRVVLVDKILNEVDLIENPKLRNLPDKCLKDKVVKKIVKDKTVYCLEDPTEVLNVTEDYRNFDYKITRRNIRFADIIISKLSEISHKFHVSMSDVLCLIIADHLLPYNIFDYYVQFSLKVSDDNKRGIIEYCEEACQC